MVFSLCIYIQNVQLWDLTCGSALDFNRRNKKAYAWTVDDEASMERMLFEKVDAIVTSNPTMLQRLMQDVRKECLEEGFSVSP